MKIGAAAALAVGLAGITVGSLWAPQALRFVDSSYVIWPFDQLAPFLPIFLMAAGANLLVRSRQ